MSPAGNRLTGFPGLNKALAGRVGENFSGSGIENMDQAIVAHRNAERIFYVGTRSEMQLAEAVAVGKKNEYAAANRVSDVDRSAVIDRNRLRMIHSIFL